MNRATSPRQKGEDPILFQQYFKSVGPRTYAAQVKQAGNGNHYLVVTEGKRDKESGEVRKIRLFIFSEDFPQFFKLLHETAVFIRANPVPEAVRRKRAAFWKKAQDNPSATPSSSASRAPRRSAPSTALRNPATPRTHAPAPRRAVRQA